MKVTIIATGKDINGQMTIEPGQSLFIGRGSGAQWQIADEKVSGVHCQLQFKKHRLEIRDSNSKNGTFLNGLRIIEAEIFVGDVVRIGSTLLKFEEANMDVEAAKLLTFPGQFGYRVAHELIMDFTNAQAQSQYYIQNNPAELLDMIHPAHEKELAIRKRAKTHIILYQKKLK